MPIGNTLTAPFDKPAARWLPVYEKLRDAIIDHRLQPGRKLPEDELASIYAVGRSVVRAALQALAHDGLAKLEPNRGAFVAQPTPREAREVFEARALIEPKVAEMAAQRADAEALEALRRHLALEHQAMADGRQARCHSAVRAFSCGHRRNRQSQGSSHRDRHRSGVALIADRGPYWQRRDATCESHAHHALVE
ncbi:MAG: GntR family transcriptional regulator [Burkholderiaceae bacterium]